MVIRVCVALFGLALVLATWSFIATFGGGYGLIIWGIGFLSLLVGLGGAVLGLHGTEQQGPADVALSATLLLGAVGVTITGLLFGLRG
jgi:hypothetical protein